MSTEKQQTEQGIKATNTERNKRRRSIIIKDTIYVYIAYVITLLASVLARSIDLVSIGYDVLLSIFIWISIVTGIVISIVTSKRIISARFARVLYVLQFIIWLFTYTYWIYHLGSMHYVGLFFAMMAMVFLIPNANMLESSLLASSIAIVHLSVAYHAIFIMRLPGSFMRDLFFVLCFYPVALFISFLAGQYSRQRERARQAQYRADATRDVLWNVIRKSADASGTSLHDALYSVNLIFEFSGAAGGCIFYLDPMKGHLDPVFSKLESDKVDISLFAAVAEKATKALQAGYYRDGEFITGTGAPPAAGDSLYCIPFSPEHGTSGACCLMNADLISTISDDQIAIIKTILSRSAEVLSNSPAGSEPSETDLDERTILTASAVEKIEKAIAYIRENFTSDISRDGLASHLDISPNYFGKLFAEYTGKKMNDYIIDLRIHEATRLLRETDQQIIDIAFSVGFNNLRTFNRAFNKNIQMTPQEFRKQESRQPVS